ncbi:CesT family type III secretion system chaperone [Pseudomonas typographi]|uniref:Type III effector n=1 Tax=Pseudomonas typographi TaxID=2715964 RepID=A0ABR7Z028_9PSED|nr:CesT family type III secretion system chaperone [Pseudomonas typographi]MBD1586839.1 type III effector [Pseudomonas typographi]MBD1598733.1 type III effector [Pseudomonas typographi]
MASSAYCTLIDQLCELTLIPNPSAFYERANLSVKEVDFNLTHNPGVGEGDIFIYCGFGPLPRGNREAVLQRLLETNLYLFSGPFSPSLAYNSETGQVVLTSNVMVDNLTAERLLGLMGGLADMALVWRGNHFLDNDARSKAAKATPIPQPGTRPAGLSAAFKR